MAVEFERILEDKAQYFPSGLVSDLREKLFQRSIKRPHIEELLNQRKPGENLFEHQHLPIPHEGRWIVVHQTLVPDKKWKAMVPAEFHSSICVPNESDGDGMIRGLIKFGPPIAAEEATKIYKGSKWVRTTLSAHERRSIFLPVLGVIDFPKASWISVVGNTGWQVCDVRMQIIRICCEMASAGTLIGIDLPVVRSLLEPIIAPSSIHCSGVFASRQYETGELIGMYAPDCIATRFDPGAGFQDYAIRLKDNMVVTGFRPDGKLSQHYSVYINHSFNPNVLFGDNRMIEILKPIEIGKEMLVDYGYAFWRAKLYGANNQIVDALLMPAKDRNPTQQSIYREWSPKLDQSERSRERLIKLYDPEHEVPNSQKKPKRKRFVVESEREYDVEALKFDPEKDEWTIYWCGFKYPSKEPYEIIRHLHGVQECRLYPKMCIPVTGGRPVVPSVDTIPTLMTEKQSAATHTKRVVFQAEAFCAAKAIANAIPLSKEWYDRLLNEGGHASLDHLLQIVRVKGCPFQLDNVKLYNLLLLDFLRKQTEGVFVVEIAIRGRHCLTWNANRKKILESCPQFPFELELTEVNLVMLGITAQSVKRVLKVFLKR